MVAGSDAGSGARATLGAVPARAPVRTVGIEVAARATRRRFTAQYKLDLLREVDAAGPGQCGAILRREGLYSSHLAEWRRARDNGALAALAQKRGRKATVRRDPVALENERLRRENARLQGKLKQAEVIIEIQKKVSEILGIPLKTPEFGEDD
jgi:transposase-like protein